MSRTTSVAIATFTIWIWLAATAYAQSGEHSTVSDDAGAHEFHRDLLAVFVGGSEDGAALGIEYERRVSSSFGVGAFVERTFGDRDFWVYGLPFAYHVHHWKFYLAPGAEADSDDSDPLVRLGGEYAFEFKGWEIAPQLNIDFVDDEELVVVGIALGMGL